MYIVDHNQQARVLRKRQDVTSASIISKSDSSTATVLSSTKTQSMSSSPLTFTSTATDVPVTTTSLISATTASSSTSLQQITTTSTSIPIQSFSTFFSSTAWTSFFTLPPSTIPLSSRTTSSQSSTSTTSFQPSTITTTRHDTTSTLFLTTGTDNIQPTTTNADTNNASSGNSNSSAPTIPTAGIVALVLTLLIAILVIAIYLYRRHHRKHHHSPYPTTLNLSNTTPKTSHTTTSVSPTSPSKPRSSFQLPALNFSHGQYRENARRRSSWGQRFNFDGRGKGERVVDILSPPPMTPVDPKEFSMPQSIVASSQGAVVSATATMIEIQFDQDGDDTNCRSGLSKEVIDSVAATATASDIVAVSTAPEIINAIPSSTPPPTSYTASSIPDLYITRDSLTMPTPIVIDSNNTTRSRKGSLSVHSVDGKSAHDSTIQRRIRERRMRRQSLYTDDGEDVDDDELGGLEEVQEGVTEVVVIDD
ncbi:hypothetical protein HDU76_006074 [Blyttiomyces sp. JEL0837]|nr:hypothetical protein HDU76_006074 [Blyttiomyces sp. JEL0837]